MNISILLYRVLEVQNLSLCHAELRVRRALRRACHPLLRPTISCSRTMMRMCCGLSAPCFGWRICVRTERQWTLKLPTRLLLTSSVSTQWALSDKCAPAPAPVSVACYLLAAGAMNDPTEPVYWFIRGMGWLRNRAKAAEAWWRDEHSKSS